MNENTKIKFQGSGKETFLIEKVIEKVILYAPVAVLAESIFLH